MRDALFQFSVPLFFFYVYTISLRTRKPGLTGRRLLPPPLVRIFLLSMWLKTLQHLLENHTTNKNVSENLHIFSWRRVIIPDIRVNLAPDPGPEKDYRAKTSNKIRAVIWSIYEAQMCRAQRPAVCCFVFRPIRHWSAVSSRNLRASQPPRHVAASRFIVYANG